jgi:hypothetical protein
MAFAAKLTRVCGVVWVPHLQEKPGTNQGEELDAFCVAGASVHGAQRLPAASVQVRPQADSTASTQQYSRWNEPQAGLPCSVVYGPQAVFLQVTHLPSTQQLVHHFAG